MIWNITEHNIVKDCQRQGVWNILNIAEFRDKGEINMLIDVIGVENGISPVDFKFYFRELCLLYTNTLGEDMNLSILYETKEKLGSSYSWQPVWKKDNFKI